MSRSYIIRFINLEFRNKAIIFNQYSIKPRRISNNYTVLRAKNPFFVSFPLTTRVILSHNDTLWAIGTSLKCGSNFRAGCDSGSHNVCIVNIRALRSRHGTASQHRNNNQIYLKYYVEVFVSQQLFHFFILSIFLPVLSDCTRYDNIRPHGS